MSFALQLRSRPRNSQPPVGAQIDRANWAGRALVYQLVGGSPRDCVTGAIPTVVGSPTTRVKRFGNEIYLNTSSALRYATSPSIGAGDFLVNIVMCVDASGSYEYALSGSADGYSGIHIFTRSASSSYQWGVAADGTAKGSGNVLLAGEWCVLTYCRRGTAIYLFKNGLSAPVPSVTVGAGNVFLDGAWALNEYKPAGAYRPGIGYAGVSVLRGSFTLAQAVNLGQNPWQVFKP